MLDAPARTCDRCDAPLTGRYRRGFDFLCYPCFNATKPEILPDRKSTRLNSSHIPLSRMPSSA